MPNDNWRESGKYYGTGERGRQHNLTQLQAERIVLMERLLSWQRSTTVAFVIRQLGAIKGISMLMNYEAVKVITGMQKIFAGNLVGAEKTRSAESGSGEDRSEGNKSSYRNKIKDYYGTINKSTNKQLQELYERSNNSTAERS